MGQAKRNEKRHADLRSGRYPCVYCGGTTGELTVDHLIPKSAFWMQRPNQLVVTACKTCHEKLRATDHIIGWLSKWYPNVPPEKLSNFEKLTLEIRNNYPDLIAEMKFEERFVLNLGETYVPHVFRQFGLRFGMAMHYEITNEVLPSTATIFTATYTNYDAANFQIPPAISKLFPQFQTLQQGKIVNSEFRYATAATENRRYSAHLAIFREAFATLSVCDCEGDLFNVFSSTEMVTPSELCSYPYGISP